MLFVKSNVTKKNVLYEDCLLEWWTDYKLDLSIESVLTKELIINKHILPELGRYRVSEITRDLLYGYISKKKESGNLRSKNKGLSDKSLRTHFNIIRPSLQHGFMQGYTKGNVADTIKIKRPRYIFQPFTADEVNSIIENTTIEYMADLIELAFRTGMRRSELYGIQKQDVDFKSKRLMVRRAVTACCPSECNIHAPKTKSSIRGIYLDDICLKILYKRISYNKDKSQTSFIFSNDDGSVINPFYTTAYFKAACKKAGTASTRFHDLRHAHATILLLNNVHPKVVQERLGHSSIDITLDIYSHLTPTIQQEAVTVFNDIVTTGYNNFVDTKSNNLSVA